MNTKQFTNKWEMSPSLAYTHCLLVRQALAEKTSEITILKTEEEPMSVVDEELYDHGIKVIAILQDLQTLNYKPQIDTQ